MEAVHGKIKRHLMKKKNEIERVKNENRYILTISKIRLT